MSFAQRDSHEAQVQFSLERGMPAVIGVTTTFRSKIQRKNLTVREFLFLNLPKITRIHFFFVNVATSIGEATAILITVG